MFQLELDGSLRTTEPNARTVGERKDTSSATRPLRCLLYQNHSDHGLAR
jgi:hypothetical protein